MKNIDIQEAGRRFYNLLDDVAKGKHIVITRHDIPVALLIPVQTSRKMSPVSAAAELRKFRKKHPLRELSLRDLITEGRRS
jgi:prevent-host-death family protein